MSVATHDIKRRLKGIASTRKLTKAMEMVAASKMRRATQAVVASRPFAQTAQRVMARLVRAAADRGMGLDHQLLATRPVRSVAVVVYSTNRGLCGSFNSQLAAVVQRQLQAWQAQGVAVQLITFGRRVRENLVRRGATITADFNRPDLLANHRELSPLVRSVTEAFVRGTYDEVWIAYTDYVSALRQVPRLLKLLPFSPTEGEGVLHEAAMAPRGHGAAGYVFEPSSEAVLNSVVPRIVELQLWQAALESLASEHAARMLAMRSASDAAAELLDELTYLFNRARQAAITAEIADISGGKAALE